MYLWKYRTHFIILKSLPIDKWENETIVLLGVILRTSEIKQICKYFGPSAQCWFVGGISMIFAHFLCIYNLRYPSFVESTNLCFFICFQYFRQFIVCLWSLFMIIFHTKNFFLSVVRALHPSLMVSGFSLLFRKPESTFVPNRMNHPPVFYANTSMVFFLYFNI